ncbi:MAG: MBL fold metallo-hydrolase [SAR324 cluster bacterium]|uniref:MBL fold metallo-hydrolase n=1 Tax=SAR324 cluster bacterium TaxID=2024889 RepID=A0A7X9FUD5_9DELT|nr:MBL fold metallo-hydrolase [SAR324 cluster bacterium]
MLKTIEIPVTPFQQLCRILYDEDTKEAVIVDPGGEAERILDRIEGAKLKCVEIWLSHSHLDHCGAVKTLKSRLKLTLRAHPIEKDLRRGVLNYAAILGLPSEDMDNCPEPDSLLRGGELLKVGTYSFTVLHTPGHSPGHLCFYCEEQQLLLAGDLIFAGSIGRTDLPGGSYEVLMSSIKHTILKLPDETRILSGHGPSTTVGEERISNPFLINLQSET